MKKRFSLLSIMFFIFSLLLGGCGSKSAFSSADSVMAVAETAAASAGGYDLGFNTASARPPEAAPMAPASAPQENFEMEIAEEDTELTETIAEEGSIPSVFHQFP